MSQNIAFDRRQQTGKLLIQNARGSCSIFWHVVLLCTSLTSLWLQPPPTLSHLPLTLCFLTWLFRPLYFNIQDPGDQQTWGSIWAAESCVFTICWWPKVRRVKLCTEVSVESKDGLIRNISWTQPITIMLVICLINLTTCYQYRNITHFLWSQKQTKKMSKAGFWVHRTVIKPWLKTLLLLDLKSGWGLEKQEFRNKGFFSVCFQQNKTVSWRGRENNNGEFFFSEKWGENENVF